MELVCSDYTPSVLISLNFYWILNPFDLVCCVRLIVERMWNYNSAFHSRIQTWDKIDSGIPFSHISLFPWRFRVCEIRRAGAKGITCGTYIFMAHKTKLHSHIFPSPYCIYIILTSICRISSTFKQNLRDHLQKFLVMWFTCVCT